MSRQLDAATLKEGFQQFNAPREEGDIDLVKMIRDALVNHGVSEEQIVAGFDNDPLIIEALPKQSTIQRWQLNRYWTRQLVSLHHVNTIDPRSYLVQDGHEEAWLRTFNQYVLPFALQYQLPVALYGSQG